MSSDWFMQLPATHIPQSTAFRVIPYLFRASKTFTGYSANITLGTQCSANFFHEIIPMADTGGVRISVAVLALHGVGVSVALVDRVRQCSSNVAERVDVHLLLPDRLDMYYRDLNENNVFQRNFYEVTEEHRGYFDDISCDRILEKGMGVKFGTHLKFVNHSIWFPQNLLRKLAMQYTITKHVMMLDIDFAVSADIALEHHRVYQEVASLGVNMSRIVLVPPGLSFFFDATGDSCTYSL
jgi:hypothetical protein